MVKVKIFGVLRATIGLPYLETEAATVAEVFENISEIMKQRYEDDLKDGHGGDERSVALTPHKSLSFGDAIVYVDGERCMKKKMKLGGNEEIWLLSPAAGG